MFVFSTEPAKLPESKGAAQSNGTQIANKTDGSHNQENPSPPRTAVNQLSGANRENLTSDTDGHGHKEDREIQRELVWFTGTLAVVGVLQLVVMFLQWLTYKRQAHEMRRQRHEMVRQRTEISGQRVATEGQLKAMREQITKMTEQTESLKQSVLVAQDMATTAKDGAKAARDSVEMFISKERARLIVIAPSKRLEASLKAWGPDFPYYDFLLEIAHHGTTDAFNVRAQARLDINEKGKESRNREWTMSVSIPNIIRANTLPVVLKIPATLNSEQFERIGSNDSTIHVFGKVAYEDTFGRSHETTFYYIWEVEHILIDEESQHYEEIGDWKTGGTESENLST